VAAGQAAGLGLDTRSQPSYNTIWLNNHLVKIVSTDDQLSLVLSALADSTRRAILARLLAGEATVSELAEPFDMTVPGVHKHLKVLERAGLIVGDRRAQTRPRRLQPEPLKVVDGWLQSYRLLWEERFDRLDDYLKQVHKKEVRHAKRKK
jgi:DNA-binding transcriptional ArsR family regulator